MNEDALRRITADLAPNTIDVLAQMPGADLTTVLLEIARRRADATDAAEVLRRYRSDRFSRPGPLDARTLRGAEEALFSSLAPDFDAVVLSPVVPFGTHRLSRVAQSRVFTTTRSNEVAADPTNALALEAAIRRQRLLRNDPRSSERVRLATSQRVVRAQRFEVGAESHFQLFGLVTAGRDTGDLAFERESVIEHVGFVVSVVSGVGPMITVELTDLTGGSMGPVGSALRSAVGHRPGVDVIDRPEREGGRGYYDGICFKVFVTPGAHDRLEVADGGLVDWTQQLVPSRKERLMISGLGVERLAMLKTSERAFRERSFAPEELRAAGDPDPGHGYRRHRDEHDDRGR